MSCKLADIGKSLLDASSGMVVQVNTVSSLQNAQAVRLEQKQPMLCILFVLHITILALPGSLVRNSGHP